MRGAISLVVLVSVLVIGVSFVQTSYGSSNYEFELVWGESGKKAPGDFLFPQRIAEGSDGSIYVTDLGNSRIQVFDSSGNFIKTWGINGSGAGEFNSPQGIAVSENFVFVSDNKLNKIQKFDLDGNFVSQWGVTGKSNGEFSSPRGLYIDNESLLVADTGNSRIQKFTFDGEYISGFGEKGVNDSSFQSPVDLTIDPSGNIFVADDRLKKIVKYSPDYELLKTFDGRYGGFPISASGVDIDKNGNLYTVDSTNYRIVQIDPDGLTLTQWGQYGFEKGNFNLPKDILFSSDGYLFAVDTNSHRIQKFNTPYAIPTIPSQPEIIVEPEVIVEPELILPPPISIPNDFVKPVISVPENVIVEATGGLTSVKIGSAMANDESGILSLSNNAPKKFPLGISTIIWTAIDGSGNMAIASQTVTVQDTTPPEISPVPRIMGEARSFNQNIIELDQPSVSDAVGIVSIENNAPDAYSLGETIVTWTVTDVMGNVSTLDQIIQLNDTHNPTITQPENIIFEATNLNENQVVLFEPTAFDNIAIDTLSNNAPEFFPLGETTVTWTVTDTSGNTTSAEQLVSVVDTTAPIITINDATLEAITSDGVTVTLGFPEIYDIQEVNIMNDAPPNFPFGETTVTWSVTDESGNSTTQSQIITVVDTTQPTITIPDDIILEATGVTTSVENLGELLYEDISGISSITNNAPEVFPLGDTIVTWLVADNYNNSIDGSQIITIVDTTNPEIFPPRTIITEATHDSENIIELENPRVYDHVEIASISNNATELFPLGETTVTWTVTDTSGNTTSAEQLVSVVDTSSPTLVQPIDLVIEINDLTGMILEIGTATTTDIVDVNPTVSNNAPEFFPLGETTVTWTVTDTSGNTTSAEQLVSVVDTTSPEFIIPSNITAEAQNENSNSVELDVPSTYDLVGISSITNNAPEFFPLGETTVTWTATDESGNSSSITQQIIVFDTILPAIVSPSDITTEAESFDRNMIDIGIPETFDSVSIGNVSNNAPEFFPLGETTVTWTVTDTSGNSVSATQLVTIIDTTAPIISQPVDIVTDATSATNTQIELLPPQVLDSVSDVRLDNNTNNLFPLGETTVTWTATDESGNSSSITQKITIIDETAPVLEVPNDIILDATSLENILEIGTAIGTDIVDASPIITNNAPEFFPLGETTVTWTATDESGNSSSLIQNISVQACGKSESYYNQILGTPDDDIIIGTTLPDLIFSFSGDDIISGDKGNDCIFAGDGDDIIFGDEGNDNISGDSGSDIIKGQSGEDILKGGLGLDIVNGGDDLDVYKSIDELNSDLVLNCETTE